jgi:hypothetical protein
VAILAEGTQGSLIIAIDARQIRASKEWGHRLNETLIWPLSGAAVTTTIIERRSES